MYRTADIGYRTNHIIHQLNDIGIRRQVIKKSRQLLLAYPHPHKDISGMVTKQLAIVQMTKLSIHRKEQINRKKRPPQIICDGPFLIKKTFKTGIRSKDRNLYSLQMFYHRGSRCIPN